MAKRENGSGTIRTVKGANGTKYYAYAPARYEVIDGDRKCIREPLGSFKKKSDAKDAIEKFTQAPSVKYNYSIKEAYEEWSSIAFSDIAKQTVDGYKAAWKQVQAAWGSKCDLPIRERTTADIRQIYDYWMEPHEVMRQGRGKPFKTTSGPLSKSAMQKIKALLTQLYAYCMANDIVRQNYASLVKIPKDAEEGKQRALTDLEFAKLEKGYKDIPGGDACYVLCYTGFRATEFCILTKFSYDPKEKILRGGIKTDAGYDRIVPVHPKILPIVEKWYAQSNGPLYPRADGKPYDKDTFRDKVWYPVMRALGLPDDLTPHSARHTYGTKLSKAKVSTEDIQKLIGHADYSTTANVYINQDINTLRKAVNSME
ncbi:MAG: tyrosine-type recombinase/integrase [Oscillospiraceae bacterium]|nr:tyrosine-type recombinase/integrase [Oscillospiraceae bacterium]